MHRLSKSKILSGLQCPKRLWLEVNQRELADYSGSEAIFETGHRIGEMAQHEHPKGVLIEHVFDVPKALDETQSAINEGKNIIFEPAFMHENVLIRADIWQRHKNNKITVSEVKSTTKVKDYQLKDVAIQQWVMSGAGMPADKLNLRCINTDFIYPGGLKYKGLLKDINITDDVIALLPEVPAWAKTCQDALKGDMPDIQPGKQCSDPYDCPFYDVCNTEEEEGYPVEILSNRGNYASNLREQGYTDVRDVPEDLIGDEKKQRIWRVTRTGKPEFTKEGRTILQDLGYPRYYIDFETINFVIPIWAGTRPYEAIPFQWSCHVEKKDGNINHSGFLDVSGDDPSRKFIETLIATVKKRGPIIVYSSYEKTILNMMAEKYPDLAADIQAIIDRLFDLLPVMREHYYHIDQKGSFSIKKVLPTLVSDVGYGDLDVQDGGMAQEAYLMEISGQLEKEEKAKMYESLWAYCELDTLAMVRIVDELNSFR